jgi:Flp pilus assembly protein TadD/cell division septation protein DedD
MAKALRFGSTLSFIALASLTAGCATPQSHVRSAGFGGKANGEIGLATRALAALNSNNIPMAIDYAERAVAKTPNDAGFRALLGSAYFAGGRFKSAEGAYKDSLALYSNQPQVVLKLALVEIAQGKNAEALAFLEAGRDVLDPADYGLAVALAGRPADAIAVLETAARAPDADSRVRQNLALAYALSGDWTNARTVAAQDVPGDQLDARIQQWMQMAAPGRQSTAVASLIGVTPAAVDPGQPVKLALRRSDAQMAETTPAPAPAPAPAPQPQTQTETITQVAEAVPAALPPVAVAEAAPPPEPVPFVEVKPRKAAKASPKPVGAAPVKNAAARRAPQPKAPPVRLAAASRRSSTAVVQLGSYSNAKSVLTAWNANARKFRSLAAYTPMSARFASSRGTFYRLSVQGFGSVNEAMALCSSLRHSGGSCFVRNVAGDIPVQIASRS